MPNPFGSFEECVRRMSQEPGVDDPEALCAWMEQRSSEEIAATKAHLDGVERKAVSVEFKQDGSDGSFVARIATLNVPDLDGDVTLAGAIPTGAVLDVGGFNHTIWGGAGGPVGEAVLREDGDAVLAVGSFWLNTQDGAEVHRKLVHKGRRQEWSYGFRVLEQESPDAAKWGPSARRVLKRVQPFEVSPVLVGAGIGTATLAVKGGAEPDALDRVLGRMLEVLDMFEGGRGLPVGLERRTFALSTLKRVGQRAEAAMARPGEADRAAMQRVAVEFYGSLARLNSAPGN